MKPKIKNKVAQLKYAYKLSPINNVQYDIKRKIAQIKYNSRVNGISSKKRKIKNKVISKIPQKLSGKKRIAAIALALGLGTMAVTSIVNQGNDEITIAKGIDLDDDRYNGIPIKTKSGNIEVLPQDNIFIMESLKKGKVEVVGIADDGRAIKGTTEDKYLEKITTMEERELQKYNTIYRVVPKDGVNLRKSAYVGKFNKIVAINQDEYVMGVESVEPSNGEEEWVSCIYVNEKGTYEGYIRGDLLEKTTQIEKDVQKLRADDKAKVNTGNREINKIINNMGNNPNGKIIGIDVSQTCTGSQLRKTLEKGNIPKEVVNNNKIMTNTSDVQGKIDFVYIKLGSSPWGKNAEFKPITNRNYIDQVKACEELKIPYGLYYYTTSTSEEEADIEANYIKEEMKKLKASNELKYNILPFVQDIEVSGETDRQKGKDCTPYRIALAKKIKSIVGDSWIYTAGKASLVEEAIFDLDKYKQEMGDTKVWFTAPRNSDGKMGLASTDYIREMRIENDVLITQTAIDVDIGPNNDVRVDIDWADEVEFKNALSESIRKEITKEGEDERE